MDGVRTEHFNLVDPSYPKKPLSDPTTPHNPAQRVSARVSADPAYRYGLMTPLTSMTRSPVSSCEATMLGEGRPFVANIKILYIAPNRCIASDRRAYLNLTTQVRSRITPSAILDQRSQLRQVHKGTERPQVARDLLARARVRGHTEP
jgi:hypothetical protein